MIEDLAYRQATQARHPTVRRFGYLLNTTTIDLSKNLLLSWVELGKSGLAFAGASRAGKTTALRAIVAALREAFPHIVFVCLSSETQSATDRYERMFTEFMQQLYKDSSVRRRTENCHVFANYLMTLCRDRDASHCVVMMDEAQRLAVHQWEGMAIVWNRLELNEFGMCVFSFGNEELRNRANLIKASAASECIGGRIFVKVLDFDGVRTKDELASILQQYDEQLWFPSPQWPFTRFFAQESYDRGWKLKDETQRYWDALCAYSGVGEHGAGRGYRMQWITDPIHFVLKDCLNDPQCRPGGKPLRWSTAIELLCPTQIC